MVKLFKKRRKESKPRNTQEMYQKERDIKNRAEGDKTVYYILHSLFTVLFFIVIGMYFDFFTMKSGLVTDLFTWSFFMAIIYVFIASITTNMVARYFAYKMLQGIYRKSATKNFWVLNSTGYNKIGLRYFLATLMTSLIFCVGAVYILQEKIFGTAEGEIISFIIIYASLKIGVFITTKIMVDAKT